MRRAIFPIAALLAAAFVPLPAPGQGFGPLLVSSKTQIASYDPVRGAPLGIAASGGGLSTAQGIAYGPDGDLYVASQETSQVLRFNGTTGAFSNVFASGNGLSAPVGLTFGPDENLYVTTSSPDGVLRFDGRTGAFLGVFASSAGNNLSSPFAVAFGPDRNLYVSSTLSGEILRFDGKTGAYKDVFARAGFPSGFVFVPGGDLLVSNAFASQILRFDAATGMAKGVFASGAPLGTVSGLAAGPGNLLYVANSALDNNVLRYDLNTGQFVGVFISKTDAGLGFANFLIFGPAPLPPALSSNGIVNAASFGGGALAPGEIVTLFGTRMGLPALSGAQIDPSTGAVANYIAGTRVLFDGVAAPIVYTSATQLSAIVPYAEAGNAQANVSVEFLGQPSNVVAVPMASASPALFTANSSGLGPGAILNQDGTLNTPGNPAARGSIVVLFGTGEGQTSPAGADGKLAPLSVNTPRPNGHVAVTIGGLNAEVVFAGGAPGEVAGLLQINAKAPAAAASGKFVPVSISIGGAPSPSGVTIAIK